MVALDLIGAFAVPVLLVVAAWRVFRQRRRERRGEADVVHFHYLPTSPLGNPVFVPQQWPSAYVEQAPSPVAPGEPPAPSEEPT